MMTMTVTPALSPLLGRSLADLKTWAATQEQPAYRGQQIHDWIYHKGIHSLEEITVLPKGWRQQIAGIPVGRSEIAHTTVAPDKTTKLLLRLQDGQTIETVGIPTSERLTACVSSQIGCPMACDFCATGKMGLRRNLAAHEILDQVLTIQEVMGRRVSHVVYMGMGEPLLNRDPVVQSVRSFNTDIGISQRHITVSTVGVPKQIPALAQENLQVTLAVSLHAPEQSLREQLIPSSHHYTLDQLLTDCCEYVQLTGRRISFEYTLLAGVNDQPRHAQLLADLLRSYRRQGLLSHVNLIPYNPISLGTYQRPNPAMVQRFLQELEDHHIAATVRQTRGMEKDAACGQLNTEFQTVSR
ncbi:MAG: 23S rRNA (adenine(2503)-C(2))-methyltransferase RlmN [Cyanophyceae cyanobacterium]